MIPTITSIWRNRITNLSLNFLFQPLVTLFLSISASVLFAALVIIRFEGYEQTFHLYYFVPMSVPFTAYLFDRIQQWRKLSLARLCIDLLVLGLSITRAFKPYPPMISGHAFFLTHAIITSKSWVGRLTAGAVMLQVVYLKVFEWHDPTLLGGILAGIVTGMTFVLIKRSKRSDGEREQR